jgi:hypothetical protein
MWVKGEVIKYAFDLYLLLCHKFMSCTVTGAETCQWLPYALSLISWDRESSRYNPSGLAHVMWFSAASQGANQIRAIPVSEEAGLLPGQRNPGSRDVPVTRSDWELALTVTAPNWLLHWITWIQSTPSHLIGLSSHLCLDLPLFHKVFVLWSIRI